VDYAVARNGMFAVFVAVGHVAAVVAPHHYPLTLWLGLSPFPKKKIDMNSILEFYAKTKNAKVIRNWSQHEADYAIDHSYEK